MTTRRMALWRGGAVVFWVVSIVCLLKAVGYGTTAEESLYNPHLTDGDRVVIQHLQALADRWNWAGWGLQVAAAVTLAFGLSFERVVRRIFASLGILIAVDGTVLLLMAVIVRI